jgi:hypothetical protein
MSIGRIEHRPTHVYILDRRNAAVRWLIVYRGLRRDGRDMKEAFNLADQIIPSFNEIIPPALRSRYMIAAYRYDRLVESNFYRLIIAENRL